MLKCTSALGSDQATTHIGTIIRTALTPTISHTMVATTIAPIIGTVATVTTATTTIIIIITITIKLR